jgi:hypothetical protein
MDDFSVGDTSAMEWTEAAVGVDVKLIGAADGRLFTMSRFAPGFSAPLHTHVDTEFGYVVEGSVQSRGVRGVRRGLHHVVRAEGANAIGRIAFRHRRSSADPERTSTDDWSIISDITSVGHVVTGRSHHCS